VPLRGQDPYEIEVGGHKICIFAGREYLVIKVDDDTAHLLRWQVFRRFVRRASIAFVALAIASTLGAYLAYTESTDRTYAACLDRMDQRITTAIALDELRRSALTPPKNNAEREGLAQFIQRTQGPINRLLSEAAGRPVRLTDGVDEPSIEKIRKDGSTTCRIAN
jgi:hypothetical protein